jgi:Protein of unknown function (DUF3107)
MKVRIGVSDTNKVFELEIDDIKAFQKEVESSISAGSMAWFTDAKGRKVGVPSRALAFVEIEADEGSHSIGFAPAV